MVRLRAVEGRRELRGGGGVPAAKLCILMGDDALLIPRSHGDVQEGRPYRAKNSSRVELSMRRISGAYWEPPPAIGEVALGDSMLPHIEGASILYLGLPVSSYSCSNDRRKI